MPETAMLKKRQKDLSSILIRDGNISIMDTEKPWKIMGSSKVCLEKETAWTMQWLKTSSEL